MDLFLGLHGSYIRETYGSRIVADLEALRQWNPSHVFTLVDDIYTQLHRTTERARGAQRPPGPGWKSRWGGSRSSRWSSARSARRASGWPRPR
jgi:hypothetical protein